MVKKNLTIDNIDAISEVIAKLSAVGDFLSVFRHDVTLYKRTPEGFAVIIGECIAVLNDIGGFNEQTAG